MKTNIHHSVEILESRIAPAGIVFSDLAHDLKLKLDSIQLAVDGALAAASFIPVVGDKIAAAGKVVDQFSAQLRDALSVLDGTSTDTIIQNAIFSVLGLVNTDQQPIDHKCGVSHCGCAKGEQQ